ncbi:hypothetical protein [Rhodoferax sp.]|uniref:hypothetical protein n=1 Tax=Rhodoferax sp. TaxID=50421 RepID=UPI00374DBB0F
MPMQFLKKLSQKKGHLYISDPTEISMVMDLKCCGLIDAEVGPYSRGGNPPKVPQYAIVRGLTNEGWDELEASEPPAAPRSSVWSQLFSFKPPQYQDSSLPGT